MRAASVDYYVSPAGSDANAGTDAAKPFKTVQQALDLAQPGARITLAPGVYAQDIRSVRDGSASARITLAGPADAVIQGGGAGRIIEINHDNLALEGFTVDGLWGDPNSAAGYRDKLLYVLGKQSRDGVSGLRVMSMTFRNAGGECIRLHYFGQHNPESGGFDSRGSGNIFRANESYGNTGAGLRLGGDEASAGIGNDVYGNSIHDNQVGGIKFQRQPQGQVCGNAMSNTTGGDTVGTYGAAFAPAAD